MPDIADNDADTPSRSSDGFDAHDRAALLLADSILHALIDASALSLEDALNAVRSAQEVDDDHAKTARNVARSTEVGRIPGAHREQPIYRRLTIAGLSLDCDDRPNTMCVIGLMHTVSQTIERGSANAINLNFL